MFGAKFHTCRVSLWEYCENSARFPERTMHITLGQSIEDNLYIRQRAKDVFAI